MSRLMTQPTFCMCEIKAQISFAVTAKLISVYVFATRIGPELKKKKMFVCSLPTQHCRIG